MRPLDRNIATGGPAPSQGSGRERCNDGAKAGVLSRIALRKVVLALGGVGLVGGLMAGCASTGEVSSAKSSEMATPQVHAMGLITRSAQTPEGYYTLGKYYFWQNRFDRARDAFMQAVRLNPESADALNGLGATYDKLGQYEAAQQAYKAALLKEPDAEHVMANMGYSLLLQGRNDEAAHYLREAVRLNPSDTLAQRYLAQAGGGKTHADVRIAPESPQAVTQGENPRSEEPVGRPASHEETAVTRQAAVLPPVKQEASGGEGAVPEPVAISIAAKTPDPVGIVKSVVVADSRGGASLPVKHPAAPRVTTEKPDAEPRQNLAQPSVPPTQNPLNARLEISNGNGVTGMARAVSAGLRKQGANVARVTNKRPFDSPRTVIICNSESWSEQAKSLARLLPNSPKVVVGSIAHRSVDIRVILGADAALAWKGNGVKSVLVAAI